MFKKEILPLDSLARCPGQPSNRPEDRAEQRAAALRAGRTPVGLWELMLWAYRDELVRYTCGTDFRPAAVSQSTIAWAMSALKDGMIERGDGDCDHDFAACTHEDALGVHGHVLRVIDRQPCGAARREAFQLLILQTETGAAPLWDLPAPAWKCLPVYRKKGKIQHFYGRRHEPLGCDVECVGTIDGFDGKVSSVAEWEEIRAQFRERYRRWGALLGDVLHSLGPQQMCLSRYRVSGIGVDAAPWASGSTLAA